jgi:hypothetical protein
LVLIGLLAFWWYETPFLVVLHYTKKQLQLRLAGVLTSDKYSS